LESGNVHKVQMILRRIGAPYQRVDVSQTKGETGSPAYRQINPIGKIPAVLFDDGDILTESGAILFFFGRQTPLWPDNNRVQAEVLRWMFFEQYSHEPSLAVIRYLRRFADEPGGHADRLNGLEPKARHALNVMEGHLQQNNWFGNKVCSIADYALYPYTRLAEEAGFDLRVFPLIQKWLGEMASQPAFIPLLTDGAELTLGFNEYFSV
ncbi:glutathione S-transferase family protein, partial [bacterium]|nr:glutathione S-transferase family protein [bacterium]